MNLFFSVPVFYSSLNFFFNYFFLFLGGGTALLFLLSSLPQKLSPRMVHIPYFFFRSPTPFTPVSHIVPHSYHFYPFLSYTLCPSSSFFCSFIPVYLLSALTFLLSFSFDQILHLLLFPSFLLSYLLLFLLVSSFSFFSSDLPSFLCLLFYFLPHLSLPDVFSFFLLLFSVSTAYSLFPFLPPLSIFLRLLSVLLLILSNILPPLLLLLPLLVFPILSLSTSSLAFLRSFLFPSFPLILLSPFLYLSHHTFYLPFSVPPFVLLSSLPPSRSPPLPFSVPLLPFRSSILFLHFLAYSVPSFCPSLQSSFIPPSLSSVLLPNCSHFRFSLPLICPLFLLPSLPSSFLPTAHL